MPAKFDKCVRIVYKQIKQGKIPKTYKRNGKRLKSSPYAICRARMR